MSSAALTVAPTRGLPELRISGVYETSPGALRRRVLGPYAEGIAQYLAVRLGDVVRARAAFSALHRWVASLPADELLQPPGPRAQLYRLARRTAEAELAAGGPRGPVDELPWREGGREASVHERLRRGLDARDAELVELRHARELSVREIAFVLEEPIDRVELDLDHALARARKILGRRAPDPASPRATVLVEAFALDRSWRPSGALAVDDEEPALAAGTLVGGRYRIVERVGVGAFGSVYRADDREVPGHRVALKLIREPALSESARQASLRELRLSAAVFHPSLVQFKDHGWHDDRLWFVMPWYEGESLEQRLRRAPLSRAEARRIFEPLARALAALHEAGIRHQDVKPDNVLLTRLAGMEGGILPVLIDLGVAADEHEGLLGGTPLYFAPEVAARFAKSHEGAAEVGPKADVFALALALRNALEPETQDDVPAGAIAAFIAQRATEPIDLPINRNLRYLRPHLRRWLSQDPDERPSAEQFAEELAVLTAPEDRRARTVRLLRWLVPTLVMLGAVFGVVVHHLAERAASREQEAQSVRADLIVEGARRRALEEGNAALLARFEQSRLSRSQLASRLVTTERQVEIVRGELSGALGQAASLRERVAARQRELDAARARAAATSDRLAAEQGERARLQGRLAGAERRAGELEGQLASARGAAEAAERRIASLDSELSSARQARQAAERDLARVRASVSRLAAMLEAAQSEVDQAPSEEASEPAPADAPLAEAPPAE